MKSHTNKLQRLVEGVLLAISISSSLVVVVYVQQQHKTKYIIIKKIQGNTICKTQYKHSNQICVVTYSDYLRLH